jgi:mono/diheme cytochrome c family protein
MRSPRRRRGWLEGFLLTMAVTVIVTVACAWSGAARASPAQDYMLYCMGCHGAQAQGVPGKVPPLAHSIGRFMRSAAGRDYLMRVPGAANSVLSDAQLAAVLNWLAEEFNTDEITADMPKFTAAEVGARRHVPLGSVLARRREVVRDLAATGAAPPADY